MEDNIILLYFNCYFICDSCTDLVIYLINEMNADCFLFLNFNGFLLCILLKNSKTLNKILSF